MGGKNPFLGWAYVAAASLLVLLGFLGTIRHLIKPRSVPSPLSVLLAVYTDDTSMREQKTRRHVASVVQPVTTSPRLPPPMPPVFISDYVYQLPDLSSESECLA